MKTQAGPAAPDIRYVKGIGPRRAEALERLGIHSVRDLFFFFPRRYEDRSRLKKIQDLLPGESVTVCAEILSAKLKRARSMPITEVLAGDETGMLPAVWFNQPYLKAQFSPGARVILFGKVEDYDGRLQMNSPEFELLEPGEDSAHAGRITPVYPLTEGLFQRSFRKTMYELIESQAVKHLKEYYPDFFLRQHALPGLLEAIREMHFPGSFDGLRDARRRMVFDEFLIFEISLMKKIQRLKSLYRSPEIPGGKSFLEVFEKSLPFVLTPGQRRSMSEIAASLGEPCPMNRLLMGDVGSGKTVVAAFAMGLAAEAGYQAALLVPTEILARQHEQTLKKLLGPSGCEVKALTSWTAEPIRGRMIAGLAQGRIKCVVGTHALLQEDVRFSSLALVVIDEQHKFGVEQRCRLLETDPRPHQLVMTATPIPRTLALTVYGDMDVSVLRELPAGRKPVKTYWITRKKEPAVLDHILEKVRGNEQAYFIFPLIEETEKSDMLAATAEYERLRRTVFKEISMGLVHGRMSAEERDGMMKDFRAGVIQVLVATSVVEVGVDNPNATMMVIENAERFGLSQLHQMRGRIGRGSKPSECFLFGEPATDEGRRRLRILTKTHDGFVIADEDLKLRGPGDFWGTRQSGEPFFKIAHPVLDEEVLSETRAIASELVRNQRLESPEWAPLKNYLDQFPIRY